MKKIVIIFVVALLSFVATTQAQKIFKASDVVGGKTITTLAKDWDLQAFQETKEIYKAGMSQETFISLIKGGFPTIASASFKEVFVPYYEYIYKFHSRGLTDSQVVSSITGNETAALMTNISVWNNQNPGEIPAMLKINWKWWLGLGKVILEYILTTPM